MADLVKREVKYLQKDFSQFRQNLIDFAKNYFPDTYQDFNESSPGMMFIEMASYVGDVLGFYTDVTLKESMLLEADERPNILSLAQSMGYKPKNTIAANVTLDVFQLVPSIGTGTSVKPDYNYAFAVEPSMIVGSTANSNVQFRTTGYIDFRYSSSFDPTDVSVYEIDAITSEPTYYLLKKSVRAISGLVTTADFVFGSPKPYDKVILNDSNIIEIIDAVDTDGNTWYHVPYLAQDTIFESVANLERNDAELYQYRNTTPYLLKLRKTARRFTSRLTSSDTMDIMFGAGVSDIDDEELIPNPDLVGNSLTGIESSVSIDIDPTNFLYTRTYGLAPSNTTLTVRYTTGGGLKDNAAAGELTRIVDKSVILDTSSLDSTLVRQVIASFACDNPEPATGGKPEESLDEIRYNAVASFASQNRAVTKEDYIIRAYSLPPRYGSIAKAYITKDDQLNNDVLSTSNVRIENPMALNLYVLGYDANGNATTVSRATKENLKTYLDFHRIMTDAVNIKDAFIINIGIDFEIITLPQYNSNEVLLRCLNRMKEYFAIGRWQINQPIVLSNIYTELDRVDGVQTVVSVNVKNLYDVSSGYSGNLYDIKEATVNGIIYPSLDPSLFEVKNLNRDIQGRVRAF